MKTSSYSLISSFPSSSRNKTIYDVFLSFRGEDTRSGFTSHLYEALCQKGVFTFLDDDKLERGRSISPELFKAIEISRCSIIVISENYASSSWCLDELVKILQCTEAFNQIVLPIFYHVDPSHVRKQSESIKEAFEKHEQVFSHNLKKVQSWRNALNEVGNLAGWNLHDGNEAKLIQEVVAKVWSKLDVADLDISEDLYGMDSRLEKLNICVCNSSLDDVHFIGICGLGGIGKTTLARAYYDWMSSQFEGCSFLSNIREVCERKENGLAYLQNLLLLDILNGLPMEVRDVHEGKNMIRRRFCHKKVLVVLDDVDTLEQLKVLAEKKNWFGCGSRIIVTTRDESLLLSTYKECRIYRVKELNYDESLQLFSHKAFKSSQPSKDYEDLSKQVIYSAQGLPLALEVLGSFLCGKSASQWKSALDRLKEYPNKEIMKVLQVSFDGLEETEKSIFLDIACFFNGFHKDDIIQVMDCCGFYPEIGIKVLTDKSLLRCNDRGHLRMHDLLREMGMKLVREKSRNEPGRRSRIWDYKDFCHVLEYNTGTEEVEAIVCHFRERKILTYHCDSFSNMKKLRLLLINNTAMDMKDCHTPNIEYLSNELRFFEWYQFPAEYLPSSFQPDELVVLKLLSSNIKQLWTDPIKPLHNLRTIDISHSTNFIKFEDFMMFPNLEKLILEGCENLREIHPSLTLLEKLSILNLKACIRLQNLPTSMGGLKSLKVLRIEGCVSLTNLPEDLGVLNGLEELHMSGISVRDEDLPSSIALLDNLKILRCSGGRRGPWKNIVNIIVGKGVSSSAGLVSLKNLELISCGLSSFPENFGCLVSLEHLDLRSNDFSCLPPSLNRLSKLRHLDLSYCRDLKSLGPELPPGLKWIKLDYCFSLDAFLGVQCNLGYATFVECSKLLRRQSTALALLKSFIENATNANEELKILLPGNDIPSWFTHQVHESSISITKDPNWRNGKWIGVALVSCFIVPNPIFQCRVAFIGCCGYALSLQGNVTSMCVGASASMDHLWLLYVPRKTIDSSFKGWETFATPFWFKHFTTDIDVRRDLVESWTSQYIRACGFRLVYEQDIEDMDSMVSNRIEYPS